MKKIKLCFIPTDFRGFASLQILPTILPNVALVAPAFDDGTLVDPEATLRELISECAAVVVLVTDEPIHPQARTTGWHIAQELGKPVVVALVRGERKHVPPDLAKFPFVDMGALLQVIASVDVAAESGNKAVSVDCFRDAVEAAIDGELSAARRKEVEDHLKRVDQLILQPSAENLLAALGETGQAYEYALEIGSPGLRRRARDKAGEVHHRLGAVLLGGNEENISKVAPSVLDAWEQGCCKTDWPAYAVSVRLSRLMRCPASFTEEENLSQIRERWALVGEPDNIETLGRLTPLFRAALLALSQRFVQRANDGDWAMAGDGLDAVAQLLGELPAYDARQYVLSLAAQVHALALEGMFRAVRCMEEAMHVMGEEFSSELRGFALNSGEVVRERLEASVQQLMESGQQHNALEMLRLLTRLGRALPDQQKLAETLVCLAQLTAEAKETRSDTDVIVREARHLAKVHHLDQLGEMLDSLQTA